MAGGIGSRFWPMSQERLPKQFLDVLGTGRTLIQMTVDRLASVVPRHQLFVVTHRHYAHLVHEQTQLPSAQILTEPLRKNTAPSIAYAAHKIHALDAAANLIVAPSDHLILNESLFTTVLHRAISAAQADQLVTLGIPPSRPDTGYGYIQLDGEAPLSEAAARKVKQFTEKPDLNRAKQFIAAGNYYWNSGIFVWKTTTLLDAFKRFQPAIHALFSSQGADYNSAGEQAFVDQAFEKTDSISVDHAILEPADNVSVVLADIGWSDLGTWGALYAHLKKDANGNAVVGDRVQLFDTDNCMIHLPKTKDAVIQGLSNCIVVEANKTLMVIGREREQSIQRYAQAVEKGEAPSA